jgi:Aspartyl protease
MIDNRRSGASPAGAGRTAENVRRGHWRQRHRRALLSGVRRHAPALLYGGLLGMLLPAALTADPLATATPAAPTPAANSTTATPPSTTPPANFATLTPVPATPPSEEQLTEVIVQTTEPRFVAPTRRDRIGRIWAPVMIDGKGPYRLVLDTGANRSAVTARTAQELGIPPTTGGATLVTGFTGSATVPTIHVERLEVGDLLIGPTDMPVLADVFGGAEGVLGIEGLANKRIYADFTHDRLEIAHSHGERARRDFTVVPLHLIKGGLLVADVYVGAVRAKAIVDTGAQGTVGNLMLREALMRHPPRNATHEDIIGVTLDVQGGDNVPAPDIDLGHLKVQGAHIIFGDMYLFRHWGLIDEPALTLGMDLLGSFDVLIIDYDRHELQIRMRNAPLP